MTKSQDSESTSRAATEGGQQQRAATPRNAGQALLAAALEGRGLTARAFAARSGLPRSSLGEWLRAAKVPSFDHRARLEAELGVPVTSWDMAATAPSSPPGEGSTVSPHSATPLGATPSTMLARAPLGLEALTAFWLCDLGDNVLGELEGNPTADQCTAPGSFLDEVVGVDLEVLVMVTCGREHWLVTHDPEIATTVARAIEIGVPRFGARPSERLAVAARIRSALGGES